MSVRPRLKVHARPLQRGHGAVQFGLTPGLGVVVEGLAPAEMALLDRLDGTTDLAGLHAVALAYGVPEARLEELLGALRRHRLLVEHPTDRALLGRISASARFDLAQDADALALCAHGIGDGYGQIAARARSHVLVRGQGGLPDAIAALLTAAGIGRVTRSLAAAVADGEPADPAHPAAVALRAHAAGPAGDVGPPTVVVLTAARALPVEAGEPWRQRGVAHLPVVSLGHRVVIGPLVRPGGPCLRCLDLHRSDKDAAWPTVLAQLLAPPTARPAAVGAETTLTAVAAGLTAMVVNGRIEGRDLPVGASLEVSLPWPRIEHRQWPVHPRCPCAGAPAPLPGPLRRGRSPAADDAGRQ